ncbi:hypothetical protein C2S52_007808 [Perilla frutescens var. hirtella]|nr:hypothetical protein C2S52_007808 [Perilla frutescens var. hirtella]
MPPASTVSTAAWQMAQLPVERSPPRRSPGVFRSSSKRIYWEFERLVLGILAFEISRVMSNVVNIWQSVTDRQIVRLREEIANSVGIHKLVSEDDDYLMDLALAQIVENLICVGKSVATLRKKCADATYNNLESIFDDPSAIDPKWYGWQYRLKKMDRKVKKMEKLRRWIGKFNESWQSTRRLSIFLFFTF